MKEQIEEMAVVLTDGGCTDCTECSYNDRFNCKPMYDAELLYEAGYRKQEWISVKEELPEDFEAVLLYVNDGGYEGVCIGYYYGGWSVMGVTHWMPLPMPPKGDDCK